MGHSSLVAQLAQIGERPTLRGWFEGLARPEREQALTIMLGLIDRYLSEAGRYERLQRLNIAWTDADICKQILGNIYDTFEGDPLPKEKGTPFEIISAFLEAPWSDRPRSRSRLAYIVEERFLRRRTSKPAPPHPPAVDRGSEELERIERNSEIDKLREAAQAALDLFPVDQRYTVRRRIALALCDEISKPAGQWSEGFNDLFLVKCERVLASSTPAQAGDDRSGRIVVARSVDVNAAALQRWLSGRGIEVSDKTADAAWSDFCVQIRAALQKDML